jgi:chromate transporter
MHASNDTYHVKQVPLLELLRTFFIFGLVGFGGPAAHLALMERELVNRRQWLTREHFLDLLAAVNLVPGPNSTEMVLHIGLLAGGWRGMLMAGAGFILPAVFFSVLLAMIYIAAGSVPAVQGVLVGIKPVVLALILSAGYRLAQNALDNIQMRVLTLIAGVIVFLSTTSVMSLFGLSPLLSIHELALLLGTGFTYLVIRRPRTAVNLLIPFFPVATTVAQITEKYIPTALDMFVRFFIIGGTLFGSGYVIASYMQRSFIEDTGWMTPRQLIDVLAIGQSTPGPVLSTASAAGYIMTADPNNLLAGIPGAVAATIAVFLPAFILILIVGRLIHYLRRYPITLEFLKGVNAGVIALLLGTFLDLAVSTLRRPVGGLDWLSLIMTAAAFFALERLKLGTVALILIGAALGILRILIGAI